MGRKRNDGKPAADQRAGNAAVHPGGTADKVEPVVVAEEPAAAVPDDAAATLAEGPAGHPVAGAAAGAETPAVAMGEEAEKGEGVTDGVEGDSTAADEAAAAQGQRDPGGELADQTDGAAARGAGPEAAEDAAMAAAEPMTPIERAAFVAAMARYEAECALTGDVRADQFGKSLSLEAARFILSERGASAESIPIHLALKRLGGSRTPDAGTVLGWAVFKDVFAHVYDHLDGLEKAAAAAAAAEPATPAWPGKRAFARKPGPFSATQGLTRR